MKTNLTRKTKVNNGKQNISSTVKLFRQRFKTTQLLFREIKKKQISDDLEPEIILQTYQEFKKLMEQAEMLVDVMTQSESTQVVEPLEEAEELTSMKIEIMQSVKQHEITKRQFRSRASSRSSVHSHLLNASKAESRKENRTDANQHKHTFDAAQNQDKIEDEPNNFVNLTNSVLYELRNRNIQRVVLSNEDEQNKDQNPTEPDKASQLDQPGVSDIFQLQGSGDHNIAKENPKSLVSSHQITTRTNQDPLFEAYRRTNQTNWEPSYYQSIFRADQQQENQSLSRPEAPNRQLDKKVDNKPNLIISLDDSPTSSTMPQTTNETSAPPNNSSSLQLTENCVHDINSLLPNQQNTIGTSENGIMNINTNSYQAFSRTSFNRTNQVESNEGKPAPP